MPERAGWRVMGLGGKLEEHCYIFGYPLPPALPSALMPVAAQNAYNTTTDAKT